KCTSCHRNVSYTFHDGRILATPGGARAQGSTAHVKVCLEPAIKPVEPESAHRSGHVLFYHFQSRSRMHRIGLALSGGGFRATLFHLGMVRFLREANILPGVSHITSVSGGSILAAHLVLNWHRYTGSLNEFDAAAAELIRFVQLDVRNRVVRRYPLAMPLRALRRLTFLGPKRQLTRTGLLEYHYEKYLYGDTCLFQLPQRPRLFILATNLSEGCLCAFTR